MSKIVLAFLVILLGFFSLFLIKKNRNSGEHKYTIGVLQTASFPALDDAYNGFVEEIQKEFGESVKIISKNADGSVSQAQAIASSFAADKSISLFYAIATPAVQALKSSVTDRPIIFAAVTSPDDLGLRFPGTNITGSTDMANIKKQIFFLVHLLPNLKRVALIYNPGEPNSVILVKKMKEELEKYKIEYEEDGVNSQAEVAGATQKAVKDAQAILVPTDNTVTAALPVLQQIADKAKIPVVTTSVGGTPAPLMQFGVDYKISGKQAAEMAIEVLKNQKKPADIDIQSPNSLVLVSEQQLKLFSLVLPEDLKKDVTLIP